MLTQFVLTSHDSSALDRVWDGWCHTISIYVDGLFCTVSTKWITAEETWWENIFMVPSGGVFFFMMW